MSPEQMERVRATVDALDGRETDLARAFADRVEVQAPSALRLVSSDPVAAGPAVVGQLRTFARLVSDFPALSAWAGQLGSGTGTPVTASEMVGIGAALIDALAAVLDDAFGEEEQDAWRTGVTLVTELIR